MLNLVLDFDGTMADTFKPSPNEIGVSEAYCLAVEELFGEKGGKALCAVGGLQNRAPIELIFALQTEGIGLSGRLEDAAENLVKAKMEVLLREITSTWPLPCAGYPEFNNSLFQICQSGVDVRLSILSSGHTKFIEKTLNIWNKQWKVFWPDVIVSDDDVRNLPLPIQQKIKPSPFLFELLREQTRGENFIYFGDDPEKDGMLAVNSGVPFGWFVSNNNKKGLPSAVAPFLTFSNWTEATFVLK